ncbi:MAG: hypothetical protein ACM3SY_21295 [Candidatus Omnitrophota bacterium]
MTNNIITNYKKLSCFILIFIFSVWGFCHQRVQKEPKAYEELSSIGFYPESPDQGPLTAIINIKKSTGYSGTLCQAGSTEYIRFFVDWNSDGDFNDPGESVGLATVNVHDIPRNSDRVRENRENKPLSYAVSILLKPKNKTFCQQPFLVKARAILSWNQAPLPNDPDYTPVYGHVIDQWIQIKPRWKWWSFTEPLINIPLKPTDFLSESEFMKLFKSNGEQSRDESLPVNQSNTAYEQLNGVGWDDHQETLTATITIKKPYGFSGDLCQPGSNENVAFWVQTKGSNGAQWKYLGTASVNIHDIPGLPASGLHYSVHLPVDLSAYRSSCVKPGLLNIRAILSWIRTPTPNVPNFAPVWGNAFDAVIQLKPKKHQ